MSIFSLSVADISNALQGGSPLSILSSVLRPSYVIRSTDGRNALPFDGMIGLNASGSATITTAPVEKGKYQSINKVRDPSRVRCSVCVSGLTGFSGAVPDIFNLSLTTQSEILATLKTMIETAATYDIETPKQTLESFDLIDWSYSVSAQTGVTLLTIHLDFQEVIQKMEVTLSGPQAAGKPTYNNLVSVDTGVCSVSKNGGAQTSTLDSLKKAWTGLKTATGTLAGEINGTTVTQTFTSAATTVTQTAEELATSAVNKSTEIINDISGALP
ncbi:MAG: hypothetical protein [Caudoviricetes sp.]|nr:MAG: hypothetical protein [Caudoviricetes sp.]